MTDGIKKRFNNAKQAAGAMRRGGPDASRDKKTSQTIQEIKNRTLCGACGDSGHWHDDPECPKYEQTMKKKALDKKNPRAGAGGSQRKPSKKGDKKGGFDKKKNSKSVNAVDQHDADVPSSPPVGSHWIGAVAYSPSPTPASSSQPATCLFEWQPHGCCACAHVTIRFSDSE